MNVVTKHNTRVEAAPESATFGQRIRQRRALKKLGLREAAGKLAISPAYLSRMESGDETAPSEEVIRKIATLLEDDFDELMHLAGRIPADVAAYINNLPTLPQMLRRAKELGKTEKDFEEFLTRKSKG